jgi:hypothetical protein
MPDASAVVSGECRVAIILSATEFAWYGAGRKNADGQHGKQEDSLHFQRPCSTAMNRASPDNIDKIGETNVTCAHS